MKNIKTLIMAAAIGLLALSTMAGTPDPYPVYTATGVDVGTTLNYAIIGCHSSNAGTPVLTYLNFISDHATPIATFYKAGTPIMVTGANTTTSIPAATNSIAGYVGAGIIVIQHMATDTYERRILGTCTSTAIVVTVAPTTATAAGDRIWLCTADGTISGVQNTVREVVGTGIFAGQANKPLLIDLNNTTSAAAVNINCATATFVK